MRLPLYSQNLHTLIIDGFPITGFADGDWLSVKIDGGGVTRTQGSQGPVLNRVAPQGGQITVNLLPTSRALGDVLGIREDVFSNHRLFNVALITGVEEIITASGCAFADMPQFQTGGPTMQGRQFPLKALKIRLDNSAVEAVVGGLL